MQFRGRKPLSQMLNELAPGKYWFTVVCTDSSCARASDTVPYAMIDCLLIILSGSLMMQILFCMA